MTDEGTRQRILDAMERLIAGKPVRSDGKLTVKSLAVEADLPRYLLTEVHVDLKDAFYARLRNEEMPPPALEAERNRRRAAEQEAANWRDRALLAESRVDKLVRALHVVVQADRREQGRGRLNPVTNMQQRRDRVAAED